MVTLENAVIARWNHEGKRFEILVDPETALSLKQGKEVKMENLLAVERVFTDARKGEEQSEQLVNNVFGTNDIYKVARRIIEHGDVQLTTDQRKKLREEKRRAVIDFISTNAFNPQTNTPHPPQRIENALEEAKIHVDEMKDIQTQVNEILPKIRQLIPISIEKVQIAIKSPPQYAGQVLNVLRKANIKKQEWQNDGSLIAIVEIPGGMRRDLFDKLNNVSHGEVITKLMGGQ
jgi:ribosome maturation protein SDO1